MLRNTGSIAVPMTETPGVGDPGGTQEGDGPNQVPGRPRVMDRWMAELICFASGCPHRAEASVAATPTNPPHPPSALSARLHQAIRWGYQERALAEYEDSLSRRATLGELLTWARERRGSTVSEIGQTAGLSEEHLGGLEIGRVSPLEIAPDKMARLARALDVSIWTMLERVQPCANGASSGAERLLSSRSASPSEDAIWSAGARRRKSSIQTLSLREPCSPAAGKAELAAYRQAVCQAWRDLEE